MKRVPVTSSSYKKIGNTSSGPKGVPGIPSVKVGKIDKEKTREASYLGWGGMGMTFGRPSMMGTSSFYNNSYMNGGRSSGLADIPPYIALMSAQNGGVIYYPSTLKEKYEFYRFFQRTDPYVKAAVELNTDLPLSRLQLRMPKMKDKKLCARIQHFYESMIEEIHLFDKLHSILFEYNVIGNCLPAGHLVTTKNGMVPIESVLEGDEVLAEDGTWRRVIHTMKRPCDEPVYNMKINGMSGVRFSPTGEHPVFVLRDGKAVCVPAKDLRRGDYVEMAQAADAELPDGFRASPDGLREFMFLVGRGMSAVGEKESDGPSMLAVPVLPDSLSYRTGGVLSHDMLEIRRVMAKAFGLEESGVAIKELESLEGCPAAVVEDKSLAEWFAGEFKGTGTVPSWAESMPPYAIRGWFDAVESLSGFWGRDTWRFDDANVAYSVMRAAFRIGRPMSMSRRDGIFALSFMDTSSWSKGVDAPVEAGGRWFYKIVSIEKKNYGGDVYNLEVEGAHTYCVNGVCTHNCFLFCEYSEEKQRWDKLTIFPPEEVTAVNYPLSDVKRVQYRPEMLCSTINKYDMPVESYKAYKEWIETLSDDDKNVLRDVSYELVKQIKENNGVLTFDTDPYQGDGDDKIGSFVFHFAHKRHEYYDLGVSPLECVMTSLLQKTHYMYTQLNLASRNMTPRNLVTAEKITSEALDDLRDQIDQSMLSPDYSIVTNYNVQWEQIGAENRLIDLARENEVIENQLFAGLGVTRELLTGEGMYSGNKISIEILNTKYLLTREMLQKFVEESLFKPVALQNGFYHDDEDGNREWFYPKLGFTRLTIRDNQEVFDQLFQLYQKGSIPIGMILDIFNINSDEVEEDLRRDMFTVNDATYNEMLRNIYTSLGDKIVENTDITKQVAESITGPMGRKLKYTGEDAGKREDWTLGNKDDEPEEEEDAKAYIDKIKDEAKNEADGAGEGEEEEPNEEGEEKPDNEKGEKEPEEEERGEQPEGEENGGAPEGESGKEEEEKEEGGEPKENEGVDDYIDRVVKDSQAKKYIKNLLRNMGSLENGDKQGKKEHENDDDAKAYIRSLSSGKGKKVSDEDAQAYIDGLKGNVGDENAKVYIDGLKSRSSESDGNVVEYIENATGGKSNAQQYIESFLGGDGSSDEDDLSDEAQDAGIGGSK